MTRSGAALAAAGLLLGGVLAACRADAAPAAQAAAHKPTPVAYMVVGEDQAMNDKITRRIGELIKANPGYVVSDKLPYSKLILFVSRDKNDRVNPNGYSVAIAHVSNLKTVYLAKELLIEKPTSDEMVKDTLSSMLADEGMLEHINVAHLDEASDRGIDELTRGVVSIFMEKVPPNLGR